MDVKKINYKDLKELLNCDYGFIVIDELSENYKKDIKSLTTFFKDSRAVSEDFEFDEMYLFEDKNQRSLIISLEKDEMKSTNLSYVQLALLMSGIKIYWLSDFISHLEYLYSEDIKI